jgi:hypothetical protein
MFFSIKILAKIYLWLFIGVLILSCNNAPKENTSSPIVGLDSVYINHKMYSLNNLNVFCGINESVIALFDNSSHSVIKFNFNKGEELLQVSLEKEGPNGVHPLRGMGAFSDTSFIALDRMGNLVEIFHSGRVKRFANMMQLARENNLLFFPSVHESFRLQLNQNKSGVLLALQLHPGREITKDTPLIWEYSLADSSFTPLPIFPSEFILSNSKNLGGFTRLSGHFHEGELFYNFTGEPTIYRYNSNTREVTAYPQEGRTADVLRGEEDFERQMAENDHYLEVLPLGDYYVQMVWGAVDFSSSENPFLKKPIIAKVFDKEFSLLTTYEFPTGTASVYGWFVLDETLYLSGNHPLSHDMKEDQLKFYRLKLD